MERGEQTPDQTYPCMVANLIKPGSDILESLVDHDVNLLHMAIGISGEAGELLDAIKKATIYGQQINLENVIEELGDLEFYMEGLRQALELSRQQTLTANMKKLAKRYSTGSYSNQQAQDRADKQN